MSHHRRKGRKPAKVEQEERLTKYATPVDTGELLDAMLRPGPYGSYATTDDQMTMFPKPLSVEEIMRLVEEYKEGQHVQNNDRPGGPDSILDRM